MSNEKVLEGKGYRILHAAQREIGPTNSNHIDSYYTFVRKFHRLVKCYYDDKQLIETYAAPCLSAPNPSFAITGIVAATDNYEFYSLNDIRKFNEKNRSDIFYDIQEIKLAGPYTRPQIEEKHSELVMAQERGNNSYSFVATNYSLQWPYFIHIPNACKEPISLNKILSFLTIKKPDSAQEIPQQILDKKIYVSNYTPIEKDLDENNNVIDYSSGHAEIHINNKENFINNITYTYRKSDHRAEFIKIISLKVLNVFDSNKIVPHGVGASLNNPLAGHVKYENGQYYVVAGKEAFYARKHDGGGKMLNAYMDADSRLLERFMPRQVFDVNCLATFETAQKKTFTGHILVSVSLNVTQL